jgi:carboxypeptidase T
MKIAYRPLAVVLLVLLVAGLVLVGPATSPAQAPQSPTVVRFYFKDQAELNAVAGQLDVWEVHRDAGYAVAAVSDADYAWLESLGYRLEVDAAKTAKYGIQAPLDGRFYYFDNYYTNPNGRYIVNFLQETATAYPSLAQLTDAGDAWQAAHGGHLRDMWALRITNEDPAYGDIADKPAFFLHATIHAREVATPELLIRYVKYLTTGYNGQGGYGVDPDVTWLVNHNVAYFWVMSNPDGHYINEQDAGQYWRKNVDNDDGCSDPYSWGVDLNRNHSFKWGCCGGSSGQPCSDTYRGPAKASEPETLSFQSFLNLVMKDQNGNNGDDELPPAAPDSTTGTFLSLHSYADEVLWPWGFTQNAAPNSAQLQTIGRKLAYYNTAVPTGFLYTVDGDTHDWVYGKYGIPAFTFEVGPNYGSCADFFPAYGCIDGIDGMPRNFWAENLPAFLYLHKTAATPYLTSYGPDTQSLAVSPNPVPQGTPVALTGSAADHRYGSDPKQPIAAAEYFIDAPGTDGAGTAMSPTDGQWGSTSENIQATVPTSGLSVGKHYILVHSQGTNGKWGPFTAVFVEVSQGSQDTMHVAGIKLVYRTVARGFIVSSAIKIVNQNSQVVPSAVVTGQWTLPNGSVRNTQGTSAANGVAILKTVSALTGPFQICVTDVVKSGYTYDPSQNVITCKTITIP